jgi:hypothetical protein
MVVNEVEDFEIVMFLTLLPFGTLIDPFLPPPYPSPYIPSVFSRWPGSCLDAG